MMLQRSLFSFLLVVGLCFPTVVYSFDVAKVSEQVQSTYKSMTSLQADFEQTSAVQGMRHRGEYGKGTLIIQKPKQLRWDYVEPEHKVLVSDGIDLSFYVRSDNQMFLSAAGDYLKEDLTYRFFTGQAKINVDFMVEQCEPLKQEEGSYCLQLTPKMTTGQIATLYLWVDVKSITLHHLQLVDHINTVTDFRFQNMVMNKVYPDSIFVFSPPKGTEIILPGGATVTQ